MAPEVLYRVLFSTTTPHASQTSMLTIHPAVLPHYTRHRVLGCDYPAVLPNKSSSSAGVRGTYVKGLTNKQIWRLDLFEGDQYRRKKVRPRLLVDGVVEGGDGGEVDAETYVWDDLEGEMGSNGLEEGEWDFEEFRREKMRRWIGNEGKEEYAGESWNLLPSEQWDDKSGNCLIESGSG